MVKAPKWNESCLPRAEGALHINRVRRGPTLWSPKGLLRLDDFYLLSRQLALVDTPTDSRVDPDGLTLPERLLCDLICVSSPDLYQLVQNDDNVWCLQMVDYKGNRLAGLCSLMMRPQLDVAKRDATLKTILEHRALSEKNVVQQETPPAMMYTVERSASPQKIILEPFIRDGMTLEDRVRARSKAREQREADAASKKKGDKSDYSSLLRLADAMWSHSRHNLRRQSRISRRPVTRFSMTVKEVVKLFASSLVTSSSRTAQLHREKATRNEMLQALRDVQKLVPEWISFSSADLSKDTIVWLSTTADISSVRTKLGAPKSKHSKRPFDDDFKKKPARVSLSPAAGSNKNDIMKTPSPYKKQRRSPRLATLGKRAAPDSLLSPSPKKKKGLRINKHFILTDADYDGGMILQPRIDESPRGLKRMFSQMNSGERI